MNNEEPGDDDSKELSEAIKAGLKHDNISNENNSLGFKPLSEEEEQKDNEEDMKVIDNIKDKKIRIGEP